MDPDIGGPMPDVDELSKPPIDDELSALPREPMDTAQRRGEGLETLLESGPHA
jgi:hypothetical protein